MFPIRSPKVYKKFYSEQPSTQPLSNTSSSFMKKEEKTVAQAKPEAVEEVEQAPVPAEVTIAIPQQPSGSLRVSTPSPEKRRAKWSKRIRGSQTPPSLIKQRLLKTSFWRGFLNGTYNPSMTDGRMPLEEFNSFKDRMLQEVNHFRVIQVLFVFLGTFISIGAVLMLVLLIDDPLIWITNNPE